MLFRQLFDRASSSYTYLIADPTAGEAVLVDPVLEHVDRDSELVAELGLALVHVLETHVHADHITAAGALRARTGARTVASWRGAPCADVHVRDGDVLRVGRIALTVMETPGHTDDSVSYVGEHAVFTGDTLLVRGCGRTDFQNGDARTLHASITTALFALPDATVVYPGHDYRGHCATTIGEEKRHNRRIAGRTADAFVELMGRLDLTPPTRLAEAVDANRACGARDEGKRTPMTNIPAPHLVSPVEARARLGTLRVIDVREPDELVGELGHVAGAELVPLATLGVAARPWPRDAHLLLVCRSGARSARAVGLLSELGFAHVFDLAGGMLAWNAAGLPVERTR